MPNGLSINSTTGVISGTVATGDSSIGSYGVDVTVSDGTYSSDVQFGWTIQHDANDSTRPVLTNPGTQVNVVGDTVANLAAYVNASDVDSSDTLSYSADNLPDGLDIDPVNYGSDLRNSVAEDALRTLRTAPTRSP